MRCGTQQPPIFALKLCHFHDAKNNCAHMMKLFGAKCFARVRADYEPTSSLHLCASCFDEYLYSDRLTHTLLPLIMIKPLCSK